MKFIQLGPHHHVRRDQITDLIWRYQHYMNGSTSTFVVQCVDREYCFEHGPGCDAYAIERRIKQQLNEP